MPNGIETIQNLVKLRYIAYSYPEAHHIRKPTLVDTFLMYNSFSCTPLHPASPAYVRFCRLSLEDEDLPRYKARFW